MKTISKLISYIIISIKRVNVPQWHHELLRKLCNQLIIYEIFDLYQNIMVL